MPPYRRREENLKLGRGWSRWKTRTEGSGIPYADDHSANPSARPQRYSPVPIRPRPQPPANIAEGEPTDSRCGRGLGRMGTGRAVDLGKLVRNAVTDHEVILARLAELAAFDHGRENFALRMALACKLILGVDGAAITVENNTPRRTTLCATNDVVARLEDLQDVTGEGPCRDAYRLNEPVVATIDEDSGKRWPTFGPAALHAVGQLTTLTFPMRADGQLYGAISVYVAGDHELPEPLRIAQFL